MTPPPFVWPRSKMLLMPAWPKTWDADFKLHAPKITVVEGVLKDGKVVTLKVTPESRRKDLVNCYERGMNKQ